MLATKRNRAYWKETESPLETGEPEPVEEYPSEERVVSGSLLMFALAMALFMFPVVNGMVAGVVGGYRVGSPRNALMSALGPLTVASCLLWILMTVFPIPMMGSPITQIGIAFLILLTDVAMLVGAAIGGTVSQNRIDRLNRA
jgi:hypothetical protein